MQDSSAERPNMTDAIWDLRYALQLQRVTRNREGHGYSIIDAFIGAATAYRSGLAFFLLSDQGRQYPHIDGSEPNVIQGSTNQRFGSAK